MVQRLRPGVWRISERSRVSTAELFFDVVFVFAFIQVTTLMTADKGGLGIAHGLLVLALLWWLWSLFAWLSNRVRGNYGLTRFTLLAATPVMFVLAAVTLDAFMGVSGSVAAPLGFVGCYATVRLLYLGLRWYATPSLRGREIASLTVPALAAIGLLLGAALLPLAGLASVTTLAGQIALWVLAIGIDYGVGMALPVSRQIFSARHWAERHNLIIILALGEVLVSIGVTGQYLQASASFILASALAAVIVGSLEWIYFDLSTLVGEHALRTADPIHRVRLARDAYTYLHLPMIAGIILLSLGLKHTPGLIEAVHSYNRGEPLDRTGRYTMYGGVALFLLAHAGFHGRLGHGLLIVIWPRLAAAALLLGLLPVTAWLPALQALACLAGVCLVTAGTEFFISRRHRWRLRQTLFEEAEGEPTARGNSDSGEGAVP
ncbi:low temperature requirement protein A [Micromonospora olivasterospora]|uniref:Low temperature requirement protein LtrA n=1 Tax=Micromonospora olivasterospora TaxID=1880 RepID=A0A562I4A7_MICOL|nr:low temperature requirement protein A [Micromonospora olivasterospora]TWH65830.1 low temperature requirement protein LtrA [Micromonospora olivasterospora]